MIDIMRGGTPTLSRGICGIVEKYAKGSKTTTNAKTTSNPFTTNPMRIALVVGHDKVRQGATNTNGESEWELWDRFLQHNLPNFEVDNPDIEFEIFYRDEGIGGYTSKMKKLSKEINEWGASLALEFHFNAAANPNAEGFEVVIAKGSTRGRGYATILMDLLDNALYGDSRGIKARKKKERGGGFLHKVHAPALILEPFFGSSFIDTTNFDEDEYAAALSKFFASVSSYN